MKTIKLILVATLFTTAMLSVASIPEFNINPDERNMTLNVMIAMQDPLLEAAMRQQLSYSLLESIQQEYTVSVRFQDVIVRIYGTYDQWVWFFRPQGPEIDGPSGVISKLL